MEVLIVIYGTFAIVGILALLFLRSNAGKRWMDNL